MQVSPLVVLVWPDEDSFATFSPRSYDEMVSIHNAMGRLGYKYETWDLIPLLDGVAQHLYTSWSKDPKRD